MAYALAAGLRRLAALLRPEGGWSAVLRVPATLSEDEWVARLVEPDNFAGAIRRLLRRVLAETGSPEPPGLE